MFSYVIILVYSRLNVYVILCVDVLNRVSVEVAVYWFHLFVMSLTVVCACLPLPLLLFIRI